jgi:uncharacterized caspase-like protein
MASNWAIVIGINQYRFLQPLKYAKRDAESMKGFLTEEAKFDRIFLFTDDSPETGGKPTEPFRANLLRVLRQIFAHPFMKDGDNFWFFFSGHGISYNGQDYLMPLDGDPEDIENTGISTNTITNYLRSCGADNAVMILDACRSGGRKSGEGIGRQTETEARQTGVISLFSCSPDQYSYELEAIEQGVFTYALLEGLGIQGRCATVERLNQYLEHRVPEFVSQHLQRVKQIPYTIAEPLNRSHLILMPQHASLGDIATLKNDAYRAERNQDWDLAQRLWIRVNAAASGQDIEAVEALQNLSVQSQASTSRPKPPQHQASKPSKTTANFNVDSQDSNPVIKSTDFTNLSPMSKVFISYAREDQPTAKQIYRDLRSEGFDAWLDCEDLLPGSNWELEIRRVLRKEARHVIVLLSQQSTNRRGYINKEIREALDVVDEFPESEIFLIPARLDDCQPAHDRLNRFNWVDMFPSYDRGLAKILRTLSRQESNGLNINPVQKSNSITRLRGDTIKLPDGTITNSISVVATRREWMYTMAKALLDKNIPRFFEVIKNENGTLIPAATLVEVIEWDTYKELKLVRIKVLEGDLTERILWTSSFFIP